MSDIEACLEILQQGSRSFHLAARVLPRRLRPPVAAVYAFCREADDAVDEATDVQAAMGELQHRLQRIYAGHDLRGPVDRALSHVVHAHAVPRALFEALLEGFAWDATGKTYNTLEDVCAYSVRVAGSVGVIMTHLMGEHRPEVLARACDLGVAMQLTNIARDVGEDARLGRLYLPRTWLREARIDPAAWQRTPAWTSALGQVVARLLRHADALYRRADVGISYLPVDCRLGVYAASLIYADIGRVVANQGHNSVAKRAVVPAWRKLWLLVTALPARRWPPQDNPQPALSEAEFLLHAARLPARTA